MAANSNNNRMLDFDLPYPDAAELKSNQSVRATFRLSANTILALNIVSNQLGIKQKSLFDHLIGDTEALKIIARAVKDLKQRQSDCVQKTFVISKKTLLTLEKMADDYAAPRDALVEFSIQRLKPVIEQEKRKLAVRKAVTKQVRSTLEAQVQLLDEAHRRLGAEDPIYEQLAYAVDRLESAYGSMEAFVQKNEKIADL